MTTQPVPCLCQCGQTFKRTKSFPLCKQASQRVHLAFRASVAQAQPTNYQRAYSQFYGSVANIAAALAAA